MEKALSIPFNLQLAKSIANDFGTPIYIYDEAGIRKNARNLNKAFEWAKGYKNFFAVKATPTPAILKVLHEEGMGFDCSSRAELTIMKHMDIKGSDIFYTSNNTPKEDFELAISLGATINIDDLSQVPVFIEALKGRHVDRVAARYNPGELETGSGIIGKPKESKFGMDESALIKTFFALKRQNIKEFGLHTMPASNIINSTHFKKTAELLQNMVQNIEKAVGVKISFVNLGGGFGVNYAPRQEAVNLPETARLIKRYFATSDIQFFTEHGRYVTGPHGYLLARVRYVMGKYKTYIGLDASMQNLMRPGMYGAYHHITVLGKEAKDADNIYDVIGSLCENNDKFAIDRKLPKVEPGDLVVIHDVGAHGHAMGFNYNGLLRSAELLLKQNGELELVRKVETVDDYLRNIIWPA